MPNIPTKPDTDTAAPGSAGDVLVVVDHHETRLFQLEGSGEPIQRTLRPYDPHHFLHHLAHKKESHYKGQRAPEDDAFYGQIAAALQSAKRILILGHGTGESDAASHLLEVLKEKHHETFSRVVQSKSVDLSAVTEPQLLTIANETFRPK